jgi:hypothetical protein
LRNRRILFLSLQVFFVVGGTRQDDLVHSDYPTLVQHTCWWWWWW